MEELLKDWLGTIAILIYIIYPLLKRWQESRKKSRERAAKATPKPGRAPEAPARAEPRPRPAPAVERRPTEPDFLAAAQAQLARLKTETSRLLARAENDVRLARLESAENRRLL